MPALDTFPALRPPPSPCALSHACTCFRRNQFSVRSFVFSFFPLHQPPIPSPFGFSPFGLSCAAAEGAWQVVAALGLGLEVGFWARDFFSFFFWLRAVGLVWSSFGGSWFGLSNGFASLFLGHVVQLCRRLLTQLDSTLAAAVSLQHSLARLLLFALLIKSYTKSQRTAPQVD